MEHNFHDPIKSSVKKEKKKSPWNYKAPQYDERSSCYIDAGTHYGMCHKQPVGHSENPKTRVSVMPLGRIKTMETDEAPRRMLNPDMEE